MPCMLYASVFSWCMPCVLHASVAWPAAVRLAAAPQGIIVIRRQALDCPQWSHAMPCCAAACTRPPPSQATRPCGYSGRPTPPAAPTIESCFRDTPACRRPWQPTRACIQAAQHQASTSAPRSPRWAQQHAAAQACWMAAQGIPIQYSLRAPPCRQPPPLPERLQGNEQAANDAAFDTEGPLQWYRSAPADHAEAPVAAARLHLHWSNAAHASNAGTASLQPPHRQCTVSPPEHKLKCVQPPPTLRACHDATPTTHTQATHPLPELPTHSSTAGNTPGRPPLA
jgi:hypothetical protein